MQMSTREWTPATHQSLDVIFAPKTVAVIGATERQGSVGRTVLSNLLAAPSFAGRVFPVNRHRPSVLGIQAYSKIGDVPQPIDLAVVATPAESVPDVIRQSAQVGVRGAVILSAGFKEIGGPGADLERQVLEIAKSGGMRLIGPNCLGVMNPLVGLNATFAGAMALPGNVAFLSQSGALCTAILDWSLRERVGFSAFVSAGSMLDVGWGDLIDYFGNDPVTRSILVYMESIGDARAFLSAAREVALAKPIIVLKAGRTEAAAGAAASHTGALSGGDDVVDAAFRRAGVLRVDNIADLFYMAEVLARQPEPKGPRLTIVTNAGGPAVLATDALIQAGGELAPLSQQSLARLNALLPPHWSRNNPIDLLGDAGPQRYADVLEIVAAEPESDGLLVILTPQDMTNPAGTARAIQLYAKVPGKPVLACWMGGPAVQAGIDLLNQAGIPTFSFPDTAARAFQYMWRRTYSLRALYETPVRVSEETKTSAALAEQVIATVRNSGRTLLNEFESKALLTAYEIPTVRTEIATDAEAAVLLAQGIGFPVVLKVFSNTVTHKTDVGGVKLNLADAPAVREAFVAIREAFLARAPGVSFEGVTVQPMVGDPDAYELILGSSIDPQFGPVILFGAGGQLVEVFRDRALGFPPLNTTLARRLMEQTKIVRALQGVRGRKPVDLPALADLLVRFSRLILEHRWIKEIDINPLLVSAQRVLALDARIVLSDPETPEDQLPRPAIRPYPVQYAWPWKMRNGDAVLIRPIRPDDEPMIAKFHRTLSERSVHLRYFCAMKFRQRVSHERLSRICFADYDRELPLVVERSDSATSEREILGVGRLSKLPGRSVGEFSLLISDAWQGQGLGTELLRRLVQIARDEHLRSLTASVLYDNIEMKRICDELGFDLGSRRDDGTVRAELRLA